jgi:hypothetical protein
MTFEFNILFRFWFVIIFVVLAILCSLFVLYYLLFNRTLRQALNNHGIIVLLIIGLGIDLADVSFILNFFRFGSTWQLTTSFSQFWTFIDYGSYFFLHYLPINNHSYLLFHLLSHCRSVFILRIFERSKSNKRCSFSLFIWQ